MRYLIIALLLVSCGGDDHKQDFNGLEYIKTIKLNIEDNLIIIVK